MRIITKARLREFWQTHPQARTPLEDWYRAIDKARWKNVDDVRQIFSTADLVKVRSGGTVTVFNIGGNKFRLIAAIHYDVQKVYVLLVMTHEEYTRDAWKERL
jgi:mRNA interferase HigB